VETNLSEHPLPRAIAGRELRVDDELVTASGRRLITHIVPHPDLSPIYHQPVAMAYSGSWSRLILDREMYQVIRPSR
jgi:hypothetical protein